MKWRLEPDVSGFQVRSCEELSQHYRAAGSWRNSTLVDVVRERTRDDPDQVLIIEGSRKLTRLEAWDQACRLACFLQSRGLRPGDVVSFQLPNWIETAIIALAARMTGLVINPVPPIYRQAELEYILGDCRSKLLFVPEAFRGFDYAAMIDRIKPSLPMLRDVVFVRGKDSHELTWSKATTFNPDELDKLPRVKPSSVMMVMYTSGTTSRPKGVLHSHETFDYRVRQMGEVWRIGPEDVVFMPSPVTHITGAFWTFDMPWIRGSSSVLIDLWTAADGIRCIHENQCTVSGGATPFLQELIELADANKSCLSSLRLFFCGGTTVAPDLIKRAAKILPDCLFFRVYGATEVPTVTMGIQSKDDATLGAETDGEIIAPTEVKIVDPDGDAVVADGDEGEILVRGPEQFLGYVHPEHNEQCFDEDGFFRTGDLGRRVHGDYLVITGRKKDIIIRSGENISPKEIEDILLNHPHVADVAIVSMPSAKTGEMGCAFVIPRGDARPDLANLTRFLETAHVAKQKFPEHLVLVDELPRVPSGKVRKGELRIRARDIADQNALPRRK